MGIYNDGKELLVVAVRDDEVSPCNRIMRINTVTGEILRSFDVPHWPKLYLSSYDGKCYMSPCRSDRDFLGVLPLILLRIPRRHTAASQTVVWR